MQDRKMSFLLLSLECREILVPARLQHREYIDSNQMFPDTPAPRHDGTNERKTDQRTN